MFYRYSLSVLYQEQSVYFANTPFIHTSYWNVYLLLTIHEYGTRVTQYNTWVYFVWILKHVTFDTPQLPLESMMYISSVDTILAMVWLENDIQIDIL